MPDRDRLAVGVIGHNIIIDCGTHEEALRIVERIRIDTLDEERLTRALDGTVVQAGPPVVIDRETSAAAIAKAYREDTDAND